MLFNTDSKKTLNHYSWFRYLMISLVIIAGIIYALPNAFDEDFAVQVLPKKAQSISQSTVDSIKSLLKDKDYKSIETTSKKLLIRANSAAEQLIIQQLIKDKLQRSHIIALNLAPTTPDWLNAISALPMYLGLDLRGGVYFLMEVDIESAVANAASKRVNEVKQILRSERHRYSKVSQLEKGVQIELPANAAADTAEKVATLLRKEFNDSDTQIVSGSSIVKLLFSEQSIADLQSFALKQNMTTLRNRVNELGVAEPVIQQQGANRIVVQLPGIQDTARAKDILGATATLEYRMVAEGLNARQAESRGVAPRGSRLYYTREGEPILLRNQIIVTGENVINAQSGVEQQSGSPMVNVTLDNAGGKKMLENTKRNVGKRMAVVFIETQLEEKLTEGKKVRKYTQIEQVISVAVVREQFANRFQTTGLDSLLEARNLSLLLRAGSLAAPMIIVEERTVGPSLGQDNINKGVISVIVGFLLVLVFMAWRYKVFGIIANAALALNLVLIVALLSLMQATLTLPGIAGIVLTVGMAVDANVLIFERIREEIRNGTGLASAIEAGYSRAFVTIADANITTLIAAIVLFSFGTGAIKGFAITLSFGIITSMFTAILGTRAVVNLLYGGNRKLTKISI